MKNYETNYTVRCITVVKAPAYAASEMKDFRIETNSFDAIHELIIDLLTMRKYVNGQFLFSIKDNEEDRQSLLTVIMDNYEVVTDYTQQLRK